MARRFITLPVLVSLSNGETTRDERHNVDYITGYFASVTPGQTMVTVNTGERHTQLRVVMPVSQLDALVAL